MTLEKPYDGNENSKAKASSGSNEKENREHRGNRAVLPDRSETQHGAVSSGRKVQRSWNDFRRQSDSDSRLGPRSRKGGANRFRDRGVHETDDGTDRRSTRDYQKSVTLDAIRQALSNEQLEALLKRTYNPQEKIIIVITDRATSKFAEDCFMAEFKPKPKVRKPRSTTTPAQEHLEIYAKWNETRDKTKCTASIVFGAYLTKYKEAFKEIDPQWAGNVNIRGILIHISTMAKDVAENDFYRLVEFVEMIIPLWVKAMKLNQPFPSGRPTAETFFVKRGMWAQRFSLYKKWKLL